MQIPGFAGFWQHGRDWLMGWKAEFDLRVSLYTDSLRNADSRGQGSDLIQSKQAREEIERLLACRR